MLRHMVWPSYFISTILWHVFMFCDVLHTLAKLQGRLQAKQLNLAVVPVMVGSTISHLKEVKEDPKISS